MGRTVRILMALALVAGATFAFAAPAHATKCNNSPTDVSVGDPQLVFAGIDRDGFTGACVRVAGHGADVHVPVFGGTGPGWVSYAAGVQVCVIVPGGNTCAWPGTGFTVYTNYPGFGSGVVVCGDSPACVTAGAGTFGQPWAIVCVHAGTITCVTDPIPAP